MANDAQMAMLSKQDYDFCIGKIKKTGKDELVKFIQENQIFESFTKGSILKMIRSWKRKQLKRKFILYEQG